MLRKCLSLMTILAMLAVAAPASAQVGPNGGMVAGSGEHKAELVVSATALTVYLLEHGKAHSSKGVTLRAVVQESGKTTTVNLVDENGQRLVGKLAAPLGKGAVVVVTGKDDHGNAFNARFVVQ
jgi:hypothetical protein